MAMSIASCSAMLNGSLCSADELVAPAAGQRRWGRYVPADLPGPCRLRFQFARSSGLGRPCQDGGSPRMVVEIVVAAEATVRPTAAEGGSLEQQLFEFGR